MRLLIAVLLASSCVQACGGRKPPVVQSTVVREVVIQEVVKPVPTIVQVPPELFAPFTMPLPIFVSPSDPNASAALTVDQERALRAWWEERISRLEAAWAFLKTLMQPIP